MLDGGPHSAFFINDSLTLGLMAQGSVILWRTLFSALRTSGLTGGRAVTMSIYQRVPYQAADAQRIADNVSEQDEEAMVNDYREQVRFDDGVEELDRTTSLGGQVPDMQAQLMAAATPLEYQASLEVKFQSYDNYCNLFHYILNSDGPVEIEAPSASTMSHYDMDTIY